MASEDSPIPIDQNYVDGIDDDDDYSFSSGQTIATSVTAYRYEHGRRYHAFRDGAYYMPNDEQHQDGEAICHHMYIVTFDDKLHLAPLDNPQRVLDVGTGTGTWAIDMGDRYPGADVLGIDLSPVQPRQLPFNVRFEVDDCTSEWTYPVDHFDFIHMRGLNGGVSDWPTLYNSCLNHLEPGGWLEHVEFSTFIYPAEPREQHDPAIKEILGILPELQQVWGKSLNQEKEMRDQIKEAGFVEVQERIFKWPLGPWSSDPKLKDLGRWNLLSWAVSFEGWVQALVTRFLGWPPDRVTQLQKDIERALKDRKNQYYQEVRVVMGKKPAA
ncbi:S-adenosyl-L-methionine-dependent methyltransferase [Eremomyces bilateralis CBS 781.70]|uniref:S-adenosyl-L-methionine-dependent methyltransferase n=1 Tax=Eremomyces bilateralis CBS 781.70 TaxID=1392243 RepID=A0A6G1GDV9_9PEZI|nr:S-adenosyl-L-methionine-dependent methyltransferase [Eremomyces bilateralis CBS 781.70]KAF1816238.1 S-adenosyl-L-methionine-dependent methyltransferase [Eremomyces bilateralis CBS 781.70]